MSYPSVQYPSLAASKCAALSSQLFEGFRPAIDPHVEWVGRGSEVDMVPVSDLSSRITRRAAEWTDSDRDRFEGKAAIDLHQVMVAYPIHVLDDPGFWRYLALRYFWGFIAWRERGPFSKGNYLKYVNASSSTESVLPRMFLRASALGGGEYSRLAAAIPNSTDFWRSHVLRVRTATAPAVARALASKQAECRLATDPLRQAARRLNRTWTNIVLHVYDDTDAGKVVARIWPEGADGRR